MGNLVLLKMTIEEAQLWKSQVGRMANQLRVLLFEGYERDAWIALGYDNWTDCIQSLAEEYRLSERHLWRLHSANETENLLTPGSVGNLPEKILRPISNLDPDQARAVYQKAVETAPNGKVTAAHMEATAKSFLPPNATPIRLQPLPANGARSFVAPYVPRFIPAEPPDEYEDETISHEWEDESAPVIQSVKLPEWTPSEIDRKGRVEDGFTVHANMKTDVALIEWAKQNGLFMRVDRATEWGNPFHLPGDGDRETVLTNYMWYMRKKPSLMAKIKTLKGKVLGCWCYPDSCHALFLENLANDDN